MRHAYINSTTNIVENVIEVAPNSNYQTPQGFYLIKSETCNTGDTYLNGAFISPPPPPPTDAEIIASNIRMLQQYTYIATSQKSTITVRIGTLQDAIDLEISIPEELDELPMRQAQLLEWKRYAVLLGRVTRQRGWARTVVWPDQPTCGMDLAV